MSSDGHRRPRLLPASGAGPRCGWTASAARLAPRRAAPPCLRRRRSTLTATVSLHRPPLPAVVPDEPHQRGDAPLLEANALANIAGHVLSGRLAPGNYLTKVVCLTDWRRRGAAYDLAPLGHQFPSSARPDFAPLPRAALDGAFTLAPGGYRLTEVGTGAGAAGCLQRLLSLGSWGPGGGPSCLLLEHQAAYRCGVCIALPCPACPLQAEKGDLVPTNLGGLGAPSSASAGTAAGAAATGSQGGGAVAAPAPTKIKLKVKPMDTKKVGGQFADACGTVGSGEQCLLVV